MGPRLQPIPRRLSCQVGNLQQLGTRPRQEDSFAFVNALDVHAMGEQGLLAVLADGMGGLDNGREVSQSAVELLVRRAAAWDRRGDLPGQLVQAVRDTSCQLFDRFQGTGGTTLVLCLIFEEQLYFASVGDSYLYLKRGDSLTRLNREQNHLHDLYWEQLLAGPLDPQQARLDPDGSRLSQFLAMGPLEDVDYLRHSLPLQDADSLLLCSDGVGDVLSPAQVLRCFRDADASRTCQALDQAVREARCANQDNYTALVIRCTY